jgi:D-arabinose 1-dehydrogenase-like Zn-dependent alcohol dehydrogenase
VQYAAKMGFRTVAIARGADKAELAKKLGADIYIDNKAQDPAAELQKLGGAKVVLATVTNADAMAAAMGGLGVKGTFMIVGAVPKVEVPAIQMILQSQSVQGWYSGTSIDSEDTLNFSLLEGVRPMNEVYKFEQYKEGYDRMMSGNARFRVVMTME